jgi:hypothetical protein
MTEKIREGVKGWGCERMRVGKGEGGKGWGCERVRVWKGEGGKGWGCERMRVGKGEGGKGWGYERVRVVKVEGVRGWGCERVRVWNGKGGKGWGCERMRVWKDEGVKGWGWERRGVEGLEAGEEGVNKIRSGSTKYINVKSTTVYHSSELGLSHPLSRQRVCPSPPEPKRGGGHTRLRVRGWGCPASQVRRRPKCDQIAPSHPLSWPCVSDLLLLKGESWLRAETLDDSTPQWRISELRVWSYEPFIVPASSSSGYTSGQNLEVLYIIRNIIWNIIK